jgi:nucleoside-diphosphate-sugar epimerase
MRVVVTGATGNVGTALLARLRRSADVSHITAVARRPPAGGSPPAKNGGPPVQWIAADLAHDDIEDVFAGADALVHLAWRFHPTRDERQTWHGNVLGSIRTFDAAARAGVAALVYASSVGTYSPGLRTVGRPDEPVDENWPTHALPAAAYGRQKSYLERVLDGVENDGEMRVVRVRSAFVFQRQAAPEQRRIFAGPFLPGRLVASGVLPMVPIPRGLRLQAVAADDLASAYEAALVRPVRGAFNVAAEPVIRAAELGDVLRARIVEVPAGLTRMALAAAFHLRLAPAEPGLLDLALSLPIMDTSRARRELGWEPASSAVDALESLLAGWRHARGGPTPRLAGDAGGPARIGELASGVGARE